MRNVLTGFAYAVALTTLLAVGVVAFVVLPAAGTAAIVCVAALLAALIALARVPVRRAGTAGASVSAGPAEGEARIALRVLVLGAAMVVAFGIWGGALAVLLVLAVAAALPAGRSRAALIAIGAVLGACCLALLLLVGVFVW